MAYEPDRVTGNRVDPPRTVAREGSAAVWLVVLLLAVALIAGIWSFGGADDDDTIIVPDTTDTVPATPAPDAVAPDATAPVDPDAGIDAAPPAAVPDATAPDADPETGAVPGVGETAPTPAPAPAPAP